MIICDFCFILLVYLFYFGAGELRFVIDFMIDRF
jgi:hypothetical protein